MESNLEVEMLRQAVSIVMSHEQVRMMGSAAVPAQGGGFVTKIDSPEFQKMVPTSPVELAREIVEVVEILKGVF